MKQDLVAAQDKLLEMIQCMKRTEAVVENQSKQPAAMKISTMLKKLTWSLLRDSVTFAVGEMTQMMMSMERNNVRKAEYTASIHILVEIIWFCFWMKWNQDDIGEVRLTLQDLRLRNSDPDSPFEYLLVPSGQPSDRGHDAMLRVYAKQAEAEAGVVTLEHLDVELSHITLRLTESLLNKIIEYFFKAVSSYLCIRSERVPTFFLTVFTCIPWRM